MKKVFVILISLAVMLVLIGSVSAADNHVYINDPTGTKVEVVYDLDDSYVITIPAEIKFGTSTEVRDWVNATNLQLEYQKILRVTVGSEHGGMMVLHDNNGNPVLSSNIPYTLTADGAPVSFNGSPVTILTQEITAPGIEKTVPLVFSLNLGNEVLSGHYKDKLTFIASVS